MNVNLRAISNNIIIIIMVDFENGLCLEKIDIAKLHHVTGGSVKP